ncbi:MAG: right-handed parallel beta-helix repeat-containing protein [Spirochaetaceae bacterium]
MNKHHNIIADKTLQVALDTVKSIYATDKNAHIDILLEDRYYFVDHTLIIAGDYSPGSDGRLTFKALNSSKPIIGSGTKVFDWKPVDTCNIPDYIKLSDEQRSKLFVSNVPGDIDDVKCLFKNDKILQRGKSRPLEARVTKYEMLKSFNVANESDRKLLKQVPVPGKELEKIRFSEDLDILFTAVPWQLSILPVERFDIENGFVYTKEEGTVPACMKLHEPSWLENQPEFISNPGEWAYDSKLKMIFYWPVQPSDLSDIVIPTLKNLITVEGSIDYDGPVDSPVNNIHFSGITFKHGIRDTKDSLSKARGLQHDWEFFDRSNALLQFRGTQNCSVSNCRFTTTGGVAIRGDLHVQNLLIENSMIDNIGSMGILLCGYGPGSKDVNKNNTIRNNIIHHTGEIYHHGHAIFLWQSGNNKVSHNTIHHVPRKAIGIAGLRLPLLELREVTWDDSSLLIRWDEIDKATNGLGLELTNKIKKSEIDGDDLVTDNLRGELWKLYLDFLHGRNNIIEYNNVYRALDKLGDGAAINISGAGVGNIIYRNYVHHVTTHHASGLMRTDDWQSGTTFQENVLYKANVSGIVRKNMTHLVNNYIIDVSTKQTVRFASYPNESSTKGALINKNIFLETESPFVLYNEGYTSPGMVHISDVNSDFNIIHNLSNSNISEELLDQNRRNLLDNNSLNKDPQLLDLKNEDFRLSPDSPCHSLGILSIDIKEMGITNEYPEDLLQFDDDPGYGDPEVYHRGRNNDKKEYLFW